MSVPIDRLGVSLLLAAGLGFAADTGSLTQLREGFERPPDSARMMVRWWWFGPAVTKAELEKEMRTMKQGGIGGFEVQPTYPLELDNPAKGFRNLPYMSPEFLEMVRFTGEKAREIGLRMDMTLGSGWPFGGPHITQALASPRLRVAADPTLRDGEALIAVFQKGKLVERPDPAAGPAQYFIASFTRQMVKRAAAGAEGFVLDHYERAAIEQHFKSVGEPLLEALAKTPPHAIFSDSLEVYGSDWAPDLLSEFQKRRGYDLKPLLPALAGDIGPDTGAIRYDWGLTLSELCEDNYLKVITAWAKQHGTVFRSQTYGIPPVRLSSQRLVDLAEGEGAQWRHFSTTRWATSANHLYGRNVSSTETWTWLHSPVFRATPLDMKAEADLHFLQGVNQLVAHGWPYSPPEAGEPGWRFYASAVFNNHNPWWIVMPDITTYIQRISWLLRQGKPVADVAVYLPEADAMAHFTLGRDSVNQAMEGLLGPELVPAILDAGYNFDFIDDGAIGQVGIPYGVLVVPNVERMPLETLRKIDAYAARGGHVIFTRRVPSLAPGLKEAGDAAGIQALAAKYRAIEGSALPGALHAALPADATVPAGIGVVHRSLPFAEVYFLANTANQPARGAATFRVQGMEPAWWDPYTGKISRADLNLSLAPYESRVLVFSREKAPAAAVSAQNVSQDLSGGWTVAFPGAPPAPLDKLHSWTGDESRRFYSGTATYERKFQVPAGTLRAARLVIDFGEGTPVDPNSARRAPNGMRAWMESPVREAAQVYINGKAAGAVWKPPYQVEVTGLLREGENSIRVVVANTALNLLAREPLPDYKELIAKYGDRFQAQDMQQVVPLPSGMMGPVTLESR
ncbi:MAG: glycoside hydrolase [Acidobacteriota bacterium]|nr:glycoside hydrolase [Acidobacteriota bacterium]